MILTLLRRCFEVHPKDRIVSARAIGLHLVGNGRLLEPKEDVVSRLGRSTDRGDAVVMAWHEGQRMITHFSDWIDDAEMYGKRKSNPKVIHSGRQPLTARNMR